MRPKKYNKKETTNFFGLCDFCNKTFFQTRHLCGKCANELRVFGDALREVLGLDPIYRRFQGKAEKTTEERFYVTYELPAKPRKPTTHA